MSKNMEEICDIAQDLMTEIKIRTDNPAEAICVVAILQHGIQAAAVQNCID